MSVRGLKALQSMHETDVGPVLHSLTPEEWAAPSACAGWRVQEVFGHMTSIMEMMVEPPATPEPSAARDPAPERSAGDEMPGAEAMAEVLLEKRRAWATTQIVEEYDRLVGPWLGLLSMMQTEPIASARADMGELGSHPTHIFTDVFCFDHYCHLRIDTLLPGGPVARRLRDADDDLMRPGIEWMLAGLPQMCAAALHVLDRPLALRLEGAGSGTWLLHRLPGDQLITVSEHRTDDAVATVTSSAHDFVSWGTKRSDWRSACRVEGDEAYAASVLDVVNII